MTSSARWVFASVIAASSAAWAGSEPSVAHRIRLYRSVPPPSAAHHMHAAGFRNFLHVWEGLPPGHGEPRRYRMRTFPSRARRGSVAIAAIAMVVTFPALTSSNAGADSGWARRHPARPVLTGNDWLSVLNFYRATAKVPRLKENERFSEGARLHARYVVLSGDAGHDETDSSRYHTEAGEEAGRSGAVFASTEASITNREAIEGWMASPFHAAGIIDPRLRTTGYGSYRSPNRTSGWRAAGTLDVVRGRTGSDPGRAVTWPGDGTQVPLTMYPGNESPDPLTSCRGYRGNAGLPILARIPNAGSIVRASFTENGSAADFCIFDGSTYRNPNAAEQRRGRSILAAEHTIVIMPRRPLKTLHTYRASIETTRTRVAWSFSVGEVVAPRPPTIGGDAKKPFQVASSFRPGWSATDEHSGVASYQVQVRRASPTGGFSAWRTFLDETWSGSATFEGAHGMTYCFRARAADRSGNVSAWGPARCTAVPLRALDMELSGTWVRQVGVQYYESSAATSALSGQSATAHRASVRRLALIATKCPACGVVDVYMSGKRVARIDLTSQSFAPRSLILLPAFATRRTGTVTVIDASPNGTPVTIEGLGISRV